MRNCIEWKILEVRVRVKHHFQQYFSYIVAVSFIGGGNREYPEKNSYLSQVWHWQTLSHNVVSNTPPHWIMSFVLNITVDYKLYNWKMSITCLWRLFLIFIYKDCHFHKYQALRVIPLYLKKKINNKCFVIQFPLMTFSKMCAQCYK